MSWTAEKVVRLRELWGKGLTATEIGKDMGLSKNAVMGKVNREKLPLRSPARPPKSPVRTTSSGKRPVMKVVAVAQPPASATAESRRKASETYVKLRSGDRGAGAARIASNVAAFKPHVAGVRRPSAAARTKQAAPIRPPAPPSPAPEVQEKDGCVPRSAYAFGLCKWPVGNPKEPGFHFCGARAAEEKSYCEKHCAQAYVRRRTAAMAL